MDFLRSFLRFNTNKLLLRTATAIAWNLILLAGIEPVTVRKQNAFFTILLIIRNNTIIAFWAKKRMFWCLVDAHTCKRRLQCV